MTDHADRLAWLRKQLQIAHRGRAEAARIYGIPYESYKKFADGTRDLTREHAATIARHHGVSAGWLMFGEGSPDGEQNVRMRGTIAAGQEIVLFDDIGEQGETVPAAISGVDISAFEVKGNSMFPLARDGDVIFVGPPQKNLSRLVGIECAVVLEDGRRFFKILERGSKAGFFDLHSYNAEPMRDLEIHSAGPFLGMHRPKA